MKLKDAMRNMSELQLMTKGLLLSNVILAAGVVYGIFAFSGVRERIVLVPPTLDAKAEVSWNSANKEYIKGFGAYIATLVGNIQPKSSMVIIDTVSAFMDPMIFTEFRKQMLALMEDPIFKASSSVISFQANAIQYEAETNRVFVSGTLITSTTTTQKYQKQVTYEMGIAIREGRPWISHFLSYEGNTPRTVAWHVNRQSRTGGAIPDYATPERYRKKGSMDETGQLDLDVIKASVTNQAGSEPGSETVIEGAEQQPAAETTKKEQQ